MTPSKLYHKALNHFGLYNQELKLIEEMSELTKEIVISMQNDPRASSEKIEEEIADVHVTLSQVKLLFPGWKDQLKVKLERLEKRLKPVF